MLLVDFEIRQLCLQVSEALLHPFSEAVCGDSVISYGLTSVGYDLRLGLKALVFKNSFNAVVDPKRSKVDSNYNNRVFDSVEVESGVPIIIPPHSYILAYSLEYIRMPKWLKGRCVGKCLSGDTKILNPSTGGYASIRHRIKDRPYPVMSCNGSKLVSQPAYEAISNGVKPVYEITTYSGVKIKATENHPFLTNFHEWVDLKDLKEGDSLLRAYNLPYFGQGDLTMEEAQLLALLIADGQCASATPSYCKHDPALVKILTDTTELVTGCVVSSPRKHHYRLVNHLNRGGIATRNKASEWLEEHGLLCNSPSKFIPLRVFHARKPVVVEFLRILFSGDGSVYLANKTRKTPSAIVEYYSASYELADGVRHLLLRFGISSLVRIKIIKGKSYYTVGIRSKNNLSLFFAQIGFTKDSFKDKFSQKYVLPLLQEPYFPRPNELMADSIVSIQECGEEEVFDLCVPQFHNFLANDIVVHNSTYARCGIVVNTTPLEPAWHGHLTIEIANVSPCPVALYAGEGVAQLEFERLANEPHMNYENKHGKYLGQGPEPIPARVI